MKFISREMHIFHSSNITFHNQTVKIIFLLNVYHQFSKKFNVCFHFPHFLFYVLPWEFRKFSLPLFAISFLEWHGKKKCDTFCNNFPKFHLSFISTYHQRLKLVWKINLISKVFEAIWNCKLYFSHPNFCSIMVIILHKIKNIGNVHCAFAKYYYDFDQVESYR